MLSKKKSLSPARSSTKRLCLAIVAASYNPTLADGLLRHTLSALAAAGVHKIRTVRVPGSYEIPVVAMRLARSRKYHAIIALGVVLQGKTAHADHISMASAVNLQRIAMESGVPVIHQILTPRNHRDAMARLRLRGAEAARTAIAMARMTKEI